MKKFLVFTTLLLGVLAAASCSNKVSTPLEESFYSGIGDLKTSFFSAIPVCEKLAKLEAVEATAEQLVGGKETIDAISYTRWIPARDIAADVIRITLYDQDTLTNYMQTFVDKELGVGAWDRVQAIGNDQNMSQEDKDNAQWAIMGQLTNGKAVELVYSKSDCSNPELILRELGRIFNSIYSDPTSYAFTQNIDIAKQVINKFAPEDQKDDAINKVDCGVDVKEFIGSALPDLTALLVEENTTLNQERDFIQDLSTRVPECISGQ